ncbi:MAG: class II glutamine amidotransferase [Candidatus Aquicultor sp.]
MCRLFGAISGSLVDIKNPVLEGSKPFIELSYKHHDGWGIGSIDYLPGGKNIRIVKAPHPAYKDLRFTETVEQLRSPLAIVHLRDAKYGNLSVQNTHPFYSKGWIFAHNGSMERYREIEAELPGVKFKGETDSERYFYLILNHMQKTGDETRGMCSAIRWLEDNGFEGGKNFLMSSGRRLYAYRNGRELFYVIRKNPLTGTKTVLVASEVLTDEEWRDVPEDNLLVIDDNQQILMISVTGKTTVCC